MNNPQLTAIRPAVDRANIGLANLGPAGVNQSALGLQGYTQQSLAAALGGQQATLNLQGMNRLAAAGVGLQNNIPLQNRLGLGTNTAVNLLQQSGMSGANAGSSVQPSQDLLSLLSRQQQKQVCRGVDVLACMLCLWPCSMHMPAARAANVCCAVSHAVLMLRAPSMCTQAAGPGLGAGLGPAGANDPYAALRKAAGAVGAGAEGFSMTNEDFPALPGASQRPADDRGSGFGLNGLAGQMARGGFPLLGPSGEQYGGLGPADPAARAQAAAAAGLSLSEYEQLMRTLKEQQERRPIGSMSPATRALMDQLAAADRKQQQQASMGVGGGLGLRGMLGGAGQAGEGGKVLGVGAGAAGSAQQQQQPGPPPDKFGLLGLMPLLKMTDPDLTMLALGTDLTSLGLNLNSSENLHKTLVSPLSDNPVKGGAHGGAWAVHGRCCRTWVLRQLAAGRADHARCRNLCGAWACCMCMRMLQSVHVASDAKCARWRHRAGCGGLGEADGT